MKLKVLINNDNSDLLFTNICKELRTRRYNINTYELNKIKFSKKHTYLSNNWEYHLYKLKILNSGIINLEKYENKIYIIGKIDIKISFIFISFLLSILMLLFIIRLNLSFVYVPISFLSLISVLYFIYYMTVKSFIKSLIHII